LIDIRPFALLGAMKIDWLDAHYHFSFGDYRDPNRDNWGALRIWNDDTIKPGRGFARHGHRDMEIITYVRNGAITHRDHLGNEGRTEAGDVQVMSAGTGILHEEHNLEREETQIFQLWIMPNRLGVKPHWAQAKFPKTARAGKFELLASGRTQTHANGNDGVPLPIHQDASVLGARLSSGQELRYALDPGRFAYLVAAIGSFTVNGLTAQARDGVAVSGEPEIAILAQQSTEILMVDAPPFA
jgi:redox-sensitive bicupin YhaK (pirin superfamily)